VGNQRRRKSRHHPPRIGERLFRLLLPEEEEYMLLGDYEELYKDLAQRRGLLIADLWYWIQIVAVIPSTIWNSTKWSVVMIQNYLKIALRNLNRHKIYSGINILGLTLGLTCALLIFLYVRYEFSYDTFHKNAEYIYRIVLHQDHFYRGRNQAVILPAAFGPTIRDRIPEVRRICRIDDSSGLFKTEDRSFYERGMGLVDPDFLVMFDFPLIQGDPKSVLNEPFSLILSEEMATKYFGDENPVGRTINIDDRYEVTVKGIMRNMPENSYFDFDFLGSFSTLSILRGREEMQSWSNYNYLTFLQLDEGIDVPSVEKKVQAIFEDRKASFMTHCELQGLKDIHFHNKALFEIGTTSDIRSVYILSTIGLAILLIACFNYINLATARASSRFREIGIRKVVGAHRRNLIRQFIGESLGITLVAFVFTVIVVLAVLPSFGAFMQRNIPLTFMIIPQNLIWLLCIFVTIGMAAGLYPALLLSSFRPSLILRSATQTTTGRKSALRNALVILQFVITTMLITSTFITRKQIDYIRNSDLGYEKESVLTFPVSRTRKNPQVIKQELQQFHNIRDATLSSQSPATITNAGLPDWEGKQTEDDIAFFRLYIDENFLDFYGIPVTLGSKFSIHHITNPERAIILNETAVRTTGWADPIGKRIYDGSDDEEGKTVIGVVKDFHFASLHIPIAPLMIMTNPDDYDVISLKVDPNNIAATIQFLNEKWKTYTSTLPFNYTFLEDRLNRMYRSEHRLYQGFQVFAFNAIFIACLGLIGLASYTVERKTKEIGVRKILGASISGMFLFILRQTLKMVAVGTVVALPLGYFIMKKWLENFAYRIHIGFDILIMSSIAAITIAMITVSYLSIKAARNNPIDSLKYE